MKPATDPGFVWGEVLSTTPLYSAESKKVDLNFCYEYNWEISLLGNQTSDSQQ